MLAILIAGIVTGSVYGLIGTGLVLTYNTTGVFNFAYGAIATVGVYAFYFLRVDEKLPLPIALTIVVLAVPILMGFMMEPLGERLNAQHITVQVAALLGLYLLIEAIVSVLFGVNTLAVPSILPQSSVSIGVTQVGINQIITFGASLIAVLALNVLLRRSRAGLRMLAVVDNADLVALGGGEPRIIRRAAWMIGCLFVVVSGLFLAPSIGLSPSDLSSLALLSFGAAAIGGLRNMNIAWLGGIAIALPQALLTRYVSSTSILGSIAGNVPFLALFIVILLYPKRRLRAATRQESRRPLPTMVLKRSSEYVAGAAVVIFLIAVPFFAGVRLTAWTSTMGVCVVLLSLGLIVRLSGQLSLCQLGFAAIGASAFAISASHWHFPWLLALAMAGLITVPVGLLLAIPAIRLSGLYLALATFAFGYALQNMFYQTGLMFGTGNAGITLLPPLVWPFDAQSGYGVYYLLCGFAVLSAALVVVLERSRCGRLLRSMADSTLGLESLGGSVITMRLSVFAISAFLAGVGGALMGVAYTGVNGLTFSPDTSILFVTVLVVVLGRAPWYALFAAIGVAVIPTYYQGDVSYYVQMLFGVAAVLLGLGVRLRPPRWATRHLLVRNGQSEEVPQERRPAVAKQALNVTARSEGRTANEGNPHTSAEVPLLRLEDVTVTFGGVLALDSVSLSAYSHRIVGLIGPNGAGKTTAFNVCSGLVRQRSGRVWYRGDEISDRSVGWRARRGMGRTFQHMELFESLTVGENVRMGREAELAGSSVRRLLVSARGDRSLIEESAKDAMRLCGVEDLRDRAVDELSTGQRRLVELARCLAGSFEILLLDEPSAGLDSTESAEFGEALGRIVEERGTGILLIEHDVDLVMRVCQHVHVLDFGRSIFDGAPEEVRASPAVRAAYLGVTGVPT